MIVGFTGTRSGMTVPQKRTLFDFLFSTRSVVSFHHGDCIGADREAHDIATKLSIRTIAHPPSNSSKRAFCAADQVLSSKPYLQRNNDIVSSCDLLIACPKEHSEVVRSGTWSTIRKTENQNKDRIVILPDGTKI